MLTINSYSNYGNIPITVKIEGQTPASITMSGLQIEYAKNELHKPVVDWKGSIVFLGKPALYDAFGEITFKSHKITVNYGDRVWIGYLLPEIYTVPNTGYDEYFTMNFCSSLYTLQQQYWSLENGLNSIADIINIIKGATDLNNAVVNRSFSQSLSDMKVHHSNFYNDDNEAETLYTILEWILTVFSFKAYVDDKNNIVINSFELLTNSTYNYPVQHYGIDETYSVNKKYDKATVQCSNYQFPDINTDFSFEGGIKIADQPYMEVRRGKHYLWSKVGNYFVYERQLYQYAEGQKDWRFHKYAPSGEVSEYDQSQYYNSSTGVPVAGAYPYAWRRYSKENPDLSVEFEQTTWLKLYNGTTMLTAAQALNLISYNKDNVMFSEDTYLFFSGSVIWSRFVGVPDIWDTNWNTGYDGSGTMDAGVVLIDPSIPDDLTINGSLFRLTITFDGMYWNSSTMQWQSGVYNNTLRVNKGNAIKQFTSYDFEDMPPPIDPVTGRKVPFTESTSGFWVKMPNKIGTLTIQFGVTSVTGTLKHVLFRNFKVNQFRSIQSATQLDLSKDRKDTVYTNTGQNVNEFDPVTFYLCSKNKNNGRSCMYMNDVDTKVDNLTYLNGGGSEKPEWHYIRIITKMLSRAKTYTDIFSIGDFRIGYRDRWFNGGVLDLVEGTVSGDWIKTNTNIAGEL